MATTGVGIGGIVLWVLRLLRLRYGVTWIHPVVILTVCAFLVPPLLAVVFGSSSIARDRRTGRWEHLLLTSLTGRELLYGKLMAALRIPALLLFCGGPVPWGLSAGWWVFRLWASGSDMPWHLVRLNLPVLFERALVSSASAAVVLVLGALCGIRAALRFPDGVVAAVSGMLLLVLVESAPVVLGVMVGRCPLPPGLPPVVWRPLLLGCLTFGGTNAVCALALWHSCLHAIRAN